MFPSAFCSATSNYGSRTRGWYRVPEEGELSHLPIGLGILATSGVCVRKRIGVILGVGKPALKLYLSEKIHDDLIAI